MPTLPDHALHTDEILLWTGQVDMSLLIRRQLRRVVWGAALAAVLAAVILLFTRQPGLILVPILIVPSQLVAQGIARRARERDIYLLTDRRVGIWAPPTGPAARIAGMEDVAAGSLTLPLEALDRVDVAPHALTLQPTPGQGHAPIHLTDLAEPEALAARIDRVLAT
ncbi:hypothetical protein [Aliiroseovarius sp.]|uniref:hypothetical protein n=1 Tax=Aliiroseovarius sp. TaxID=1872442 RepID=UPI002620BA88|nr:hypothetical protein [Aliiroseovarius sp.]